MDSTHPESQAFEIGEKKRTLRLGPKAFRLAKSRHKVRVPFSEFADPDFDMLLTIGWIACLPGEPDLNQETFVDELEDSGRMMEFIAVVGELLAKMTEGNVKAAPKKKK